MSVSSLGITVEYDCSSRNVPPIDIWFATEVVTVFEVSTSYKDSVPEVARGVSKSPSVKVADAVSPLRILITGASFTPYMVIVRVADAVPPSLSVMV